MPLLRKEIKEEVLFLYLSDLKTQNAFSPQMAQELSAILDNEDFKAIVLSHDHKFFCSGGNLKYYKQLDSKEAGLSENKKIAKILEALSSYCVPKVCIVNGPCLGGGLELVSCFDYVLATPQALFGLWQRRVGLTFGWGGQKRLLRRIESQHLQNWLLGGDTLSVYKAHRLGLVDDIVLSSEGLKRASHWVHQCLKWGSVKKVMLEADNQSAAFEKLWHGEVHMSILKKFK